jgi:hypothetical protein
LRDLHVRGGLADCADAEGEAVISAERLDKVVEGLQALINYNDRDVFLTARVRPAIALINELRAQGLSQEDREALERDAARYRWLREPERGLHPDSMPAGRPFICIYHGSFGRWTGEHADREIDAAILRRLGGQTT